MFLNRRKISSNHLVNFDAKVENGKVIFTQSDIYGDECYNIVEMPIKDYMLYFLNPIIQEYAYLLKDSYSNKIFDFQTEDYINKDKLLREKALAEVLKYVTNTPEVISFTHKFLDYKKGDIVKKVADETPSFKEAIKEDERSMFEYYMQSLKELRKERGEKGSKNDRYIEYICECAQNELGNNDLTKAIKAVDEYEIGLVKFDEMQDEAFKTYTDKYLAGVTRNKFLKFANKAKQQLGDDFDEVEDEIDDQYNERLKTINKKCGNRINIIRRTL